MAKKQENKKTRKQESKPIKLLIFDFDGTLQKSLGVNLHAANFCLSGLGCRKIKVDKIQATIGAPIEEYYPSLMNKNKDRWRELKSCVEKNIPDFMAKHLKLYAGVKETLAELRKRGIKLVLYSNAPAPYFDACLKTNNLQSYFDFTACHEEGETKISTVKKIIRKFKTPAAVVGDRIHDLEAARANGCLAVGCLYGFAPEEARKADITINSFRDLLKVFS
jgi:phosphoglycolate phosphatase-like HAD superfamily hydrolase